MNMKGHYIDIIENINYQFGCDLGCSHCETSSGPYPRLDYSDREPPEKT